MAIRESRSGQTALLAPMIALALALAVLTGCDSSDTVGGTSYPPFGGDWLIPSGEVLDGGPGVDGIPSIDDPKFASVNETHYVQDDRFVVGIRIGDEVRAYPHQVLDWHEIVNDQVGGDFFAITYCPLTGTGTAWNRSIGGRTSEFGVSGLIFRNNLIAYDRNTGSYWSQMQLRAVRGQLSTTEVETFPVVETTWETWQKLYPDSDVLTTDTGFQRDYEGFAYEPTYFTNHRHIYFPVRNRDERLQNKDRVHGIIADTPADESATVRVYPIADFGAGVRIVEDRIDGQDYLVVGSTDLNFAVAFERALADGTPVNARAVQDELPIVMEDDEGNRWDLFGTAVEGPRQGERLVHARSYTGYWFGWADFFPELEIYTEG